MMARIDARLGTGLLLLAIAVAAGSLVACSGASGDVPPPSEDGPERAALVSVYFSTGRSLVEERRVVDADDLYAATLAELLAAEPETPGIAVVQPRVGVRSVTFEDGLITIDWERAVLDFEADSEEYKIAWGAFLVTFGQFPEVDKLAFTVEGQSSGTIDGSDIETFWDAVTLESQPWDVTRIPGNDAESPGDEVSD